jgi:hypothetical protein
MSGFLGLLGGRKIDFSISPQTNGRLERVYRYLGARLRAVCKLPTKKDWDLRLQQAVFTFRTSELDSTGMSPHEAVFWKRPRLPMDIIWGDASGALNYALVSAEALKTDIKELVG